MGTTTVMYTMGELTVPLLMRQLLLKAKPYKDYKVNLTR